MQTRIETEVSVADFDPPRSKDTRGAGWAVALLCIGLSAAVGLPFFFMGRTQDGKPSRLQMPVTHDMHLHFEQMKSFYNGLAAGVIYPRWEEDTNRGFGAPTTSYYPPGIYYLTSALYAFTGTWWRALLGTHWILLIASGAAIYIYARQVMSPKAAAVAMAAYTCLPYHLLDQYQRGAIAEMLGFIWMPLMLLFSERLFRKPLSSIASHDRTVSGLLLNVAGLAASYGAFLWSHPPTAYQFTLAFGLAVLLLAWRRRDFRGLLYVGLAMALAIATSAAYLLAAALEQDLIRHEYVSESWPYHATYVFLHALPYREPHMGFFNLVDAIWVFSTFSILICALLLLLYKRGVSVELRESVLLWLVIGCFAGFMMTEPSALIGRHIPKIDIGVFTWRMLSISTLVVALYAGACAQAAIDKAGEGQGLLRGALVSLAVFITVGGVLFSIIAVGAPMYNAPAFVPSLEHVNFATIPRTAYPDPLELPHVDRAELAEGKGDISIEQWDPEHRQLRVVLNDADRLVIRTFNFPAWTATVNDQPAPILTGEELGDIRLDLMPGTHVVKLDFKNTPIRRASEMVTLGSSLILIAMAMIAFIARRRGRVYA